MHPKIADKTPFADLQWNELMNETLIFIFRLNIFIFNVFILLFAGAPVSFGFCIHKCWYYKSFNVTQDLIPNTLTLWPKFLF